MDQRSNQLDDEGWIEDRNTTMPRVEESIVIESVEFRDDDVDTETERIKADIEDTRAEMGQTLNEIQERLSPEHIMGQVKETVREATIGKVERVMEQMGEKISNVTEPAMEAMGTVGEKLRDTGSTVTNIVRRNPIPFALMGLGLGMFIVNRVRNADSGTGRSRMYESDTEIGYGMATPRYAGTARQYGSQYDTSSGEYAGASRQYGASGRKGLSRVRETANEFAHETAEKVSHLGHQAKEGALRAGRGFQHMVQENPLAVAAGAVAVGAAVGLALPRTRLEHEYMGEASEKIVDKAQQVARDAMDKVKSATQGSEGQQGGQKQMGQGQQSGQGQSGGQGQPGGAGGRTGQSQAGGSESGHGQPGKTISGRPTPTA